MTCNEPARSRLMEIQGGTCALCPAAERLVVDHDHETGLIRGLLCQGCNTREGRTRSGLYRTVADEAMLAYRANPPAAGHGWVYERGWVYGPDPVLPSIEEAGAVLQSVDLPPVDLPPVKPKRRRGRPELRGHSSIAVTSRYLDHLTNDTAGKALMTTRLPDLEAG